MKKTRLGFLVGSIALLCVVILVIVYIQFFSYFPLRTSFPDYPETMVLYKVEDEITQQFGALDYGFTNDIPSEEEAINIAEEYLLDNDLLPDDAVFGFAELTQGYLVSDGKVLEENIIDYSITYTRELSGYPVVGPGDTIWVVIAQDNEVVFCYKNWRILRAYKEVPIISPEEAYEKLLANDIIDPPMSIESFEVHAVSLGYYALSSDEEFYYPVWIFYGPSTSMVYFAVDAMIASR